MNLHIVRTLTKCIKLSIPMRRDVFSKLEFALRKIQEIK